MKFKKFDHYYDLHVPVYQNYLANGFINHNSGKTIDNCILATMYLETCKDKIHLSSGSTIGNAKLNIGVCNGFGLEAMFRGRCKWGKYKDNEALFLYTQTGEKIVIFAGGGKADSYKRILGNSYGLWIATEINEHFDSDDSRISFIKVAMGRQLAAIKPYTLWDFNPCYPEHTIYTGYIEPYGKAFVGGFLYEHFTLRDNATITPERMAAIMSQYTPGSIWYRRDILGERVVAKGLIFPGFADNPLPHIVGGEGKAPPVNLRGFSKVIIGVDFGGNGAQTCFFATGYIGYRRLHGLAEDALPVTLAIDANAICRAFVAFYRRVMALCGRVDLVLPDSASPTLINSLVSAARAAGLNARIIKGCRKNPISERPRTVDRLLGQGRLTLDAGCPETIRALRELRWSEDRPDEPEDKNLGNINDRWDAFCYTWLDFVEFIDRLAVT